MNESHRTDTIRAMNEQDLKGLLALKDVKGLGSKRTITLLERFSTIGQIFDADYHEFSDIGFVSEDFFERIQQAALRTEEYQDVVAECKDAEIDFISVLDEGFPSQLEEARVSPFLFTKGDTELLKRPCISIVGSRDSTEESINWAYSVAQSLSQKGYVVVSGGARGIDTAAHKGALAGSGETICVLGSGISNVYPEENNNLIEKITQSGLVISHRTPTQNVNRYSLLDRNEITSGLSYSLLIVTSSGQGGTASQYEDAVAQNKQILCPDPSLGLEPAEGVREMLEENHTQIVQNVDDITDALESQPKQMSFDEL